MRVPVAVLYGNGINAEDELKRSFELAGAQVTMLHVEDVLNFRTQLKGFKILAFPGGFSYGDHLGSGKVLSFLLKRTLGDDIREFIEQDRLVLGICNGFQVIAAMGLVPDTAEQQKPEAALVFNSNGRFIDKWVTIKAQSANNSPWLSGITELSMPIRHGEGRFIPGKLLDQQALRSQIAFTYTDNPNGSWESVAGITNKTGRILGMMPHPEAYMYSIQNHKAAKNLEPSPTQQLFVNGVKHFL